jgi:thiol:disulfide interchange protein
MKQSFPPFIKPGRFSITLTQALTLGVVLILAGLILLVKNYQPGVTPTTETAISVKTAAEVAAATPNLFLEAVTNSPEKDPPVAEVLPEVQFDQHLAAGKPVVAFFHSNNCVQCMKMIEVVEQVYPAFADTVALVDVNVYDPQTQSLLQRAGIRAIPTMIFVDAADQGQGIMGLMEPDAFRSELQRLAAE